MEATEILGRQAEYVERALRIFHPGAAAVELRALNVGGKRAVCEVFGDLAALARRAVELDQAGAQGVYFTLNPVRPDLVGSKTSCRKADVLERHWLPLDIDPLRPRDTSSTDAERAAAWAVLDRCRGLLDTAGLRTPVVGDSGNGWHLCYPILLPNDDDSHALVRAVLRGLHARCGDALTDEEEKAIKEGRPLEKAKAKVEQDVHDAPRIWKLPGTKPRKGQPSAERPHRWARLVEGEAWDRAAGEANAHALTALLSRWQAEEDMRRGRPATTATSWARAALAAELAAVTAATPGERNNQLNRSAFALGQIVAGGSLARAEVEAALTAAALALGLGEVEIRPTVRSGLDAGALEPRVAPETNGRAKKATRVPAEPGPPPPPPPRVEPFPLEVLPPALERFVVEGARSLCCPPDYLAVPLLVAAGSAIGASRALRLTSDWWVLPSLYACVVAPPGSSKSPAAGRALSAVRHRQRDNYRAWKIRKKEWDLLPSEERDEQPKFTRTYTSDVTTEKLVGLLGDCPRGLLYHRDELLSWISSMDQYHQGGKGADRQVFMALWDHQSISIERKGHEEGLPVTVHRPFLSVFGTIQPDVVGRLTNEGEQDGFIERILFSHAEPTSERVWHWEGISQEARRAWEDTAGRLYALRMGEAVDADDDPWPLFLELDDSGRAAWERWYAGHQRLREDLPEAMWACHAKLESYCARLALLIQLLWYADDAGRYHPGGTPAVIGGVVEDAGRLVRYFLSHARQVYGCLGLTGTDRKVEQVVAWLRKKDGECTARAILASKVAGTRTMTEAHKLIEAMTDRCLGTVTDVKSSLGGPAVTTFKLW
jgi:hypothetical protein